MKTATDNLSTADLLRLMADRVEAIEEKVAAKPPQQEAGSLGETPRYGIANNCKGKVALAIWAMYRAGWIVKADGTPASNVEDVARCIGASMGEDFRHWKQTMQAVFDKSNPQEAIWEMEGEVNKHVRQRRKG